MKDNFQTDYTRENARKVQQQNHSERVHAEVIARQANDEEVEKFIQEQSQPKRKRIVWNRNKLGFAINAMKNLANGKVQFINGEMVNPIKLDLSGLRPKEV